jgi:ketosteroid isomerase-like protein/uncharacterized glyoxalase superfamily protein PhnB
MARLSIEACTAAPEPTTEDIMTTATLPSADVDAITSTGKLWSEACVARDWDALLSLCSEDIVFLPPEEPAVAGKQVKSWLENYPEIRSLAVDFEHVDGQDQLAVARGRFTMSIVPAGAPTPLTVTGKFTDTFRKDGRGRWLYTSVIWNSSLPSPLTGLAAKAAQAPLQARGLSPALTVDDLDQSVKFFEGLGFVVSDRWEEDGKLLGVMLGAGMAMLGLSQDDGKAGTGRTKGVGSRIFIETKQSVDQLAAAAAKAGVAIEKAPHDTPWNSRAFEVRTPEGFALTISTPMS